MAIELRFLDPNLLYAERGPFATTARIEELKQSILKHGLVQPPTVVPIDGRYKILDGVLRVHAAKEIGFKTIACQVLTGLTEEQINELWALSCGRGF